MSFTDDDLKRLKEAIQADHEIGEMGTLEADEVDRLFRISGPALIARLEAAEAVFDIDDIDCPAYGTWMSRMAAWRKSKGE